MDFNTKQEASLHAYNKAIIYTPRCRSCSCGTLLALMETFDLKDESLYRAACGLHGGIGGRGDVCGALLGGSLLLGLVCGSSLSELDQEAEVLPPGEERPDEATPLVGKLYDSFKMQFHRVNCKEIRSGFETEIISNTQKRNLSDTERTERLFRKCDELSAWTAAMTAKILWDLLYGK